MDAFYYFLRQLEEAVGLPFNSLRGDEMLADVEDWDSVAIISFVAMADDNYQLRLSGRRVAACETVSELYQLVAHAGVGAPEPA